MNDEQPKQSKRKLRIGIRVCCVLLVILVVFWNLEVVFREPPADYCSRNLKWIENELEMYDMDTIPTRGTSVIEGKGEMLETYGLVKKIEGNLSFPRYADDNACKKINNVYSIFRQGEQNDYKLFVKCRIHGSKEDIRLEREWRKTEEEYLEALKLLMWISIVAAMFSFI